MVNNNSSTTKALATTIIIAYIPVLHEGYRRFFTKHANAKTLYIIGQNFIDELDHLKRKDIRRLDPQLVKKAIQSWKIFEQVEILNQNNIKKILGFKSLDSNSEIKKNLKKEKIHIIAPDEEISHLVIQKYLPDNPIEFDSIFLRWDKKQATHKFKVTPDSSITANEFQNTIMHLAKIQAQKSSDWWRQIGAVAVKNKKILLTAYNHHLPDEQQPYFDGDPRSNFKKGQHIELSTAQHAEAGLIAAAAKKGISLDGAELFVTTFPCPVCAKLIAETGIKKLYYLEGYAMLDGEKVLKNNNIAIIQIKFSS